MQITKLPDYQITQWSLLSRNDCSLDVPVSIHHVLQDLLQARERGLAGNVFGRANLLFSDQGEGLADAVGRVMEGRLESDFGVVQAIGVEFDLRAFGASAEEVDSAALANHFRGPDPCFRAAHSLNHDVGAAA